MAATTRSSGVRFLRIIIAASVWAALIWFFVRTFDGMPTAIHWQQVLTPSALGALGAFAGLFAAAMWLRTIRWRGLLPKHLRRRPGMYGVFSWAFLVASIAPFRSGELMRPAWVRRQGGSFMEATGTVISERLADLVPLGGMLAVAATQAPAAAEIISPRLSPAFSDWIGPAVFALLLISHLAITAGATRLGRHQPASGTDNNAAGRIELLLSGLRFAARPMPYVRLMGLTMLIWAGLGLGYAVVFSTLIPGLPWIAGIGALALANLAGLLWISPGNVGPYEAAVTMVLTGYGVAPQEALVAAITLHTMILIATCALGLAGRLDMVRRGASPVGLV